ncbi:MAG: hypothetical protein IJ420_07700 [Lachnospiraceae bacterium]|nr:hypothetical protein [Lachnospiraceae bacterium]
MNASKELLSKAVSKRQDNKENVADVLKELSGQTPPESEDYHKFIRNISMPREEDYVQLIAKQLDMLNRKEELLAELEKIEVPQEVQEEKEVEKAGTAAHQKKDTEIKKAETAVTQTLQTVKQEKTPSKEEIRKREIEQELKRLDEEMAFLKKNLEDMFPESRRLQCMIYPSFREGELLSVGVIKNRGCAYEDGEELCERIKPETKQERAMLLLGNKILQQEIYQVLNIEIYPEAVCVVYPNGLTKVYR